MEGMIHKFPAILTLIFITLTLTPRALSAPPAHTTTLTERYLIKFKKSVKNHQIVQTLDNPGMIIRDYYPEIDVYSVDLQSQSLVQNLKQKTPNEIAYMEKDSIVHAIGKVTSAEVLPNDPEFKNQKEYLRTHIQSAWDITTGSRNIVVAISDTGISFDHPDLKNNIWTNPNETAGNGLDDDSNGYVDDIHGWDFVRQNNNPIDENNHGTHVAGIIGAEGNNGAGIAGMNWQVSLMPVKFLDGAGSGYTSDGISTILYAAKNGARIISCSWGGGEDSQALKDAIKYAYDHGALVIAAAGNSSENLDSHPSYPGAYGSSGLISVASSADVGQLSDFSNYGIFGTMIAAPGSNILSSVRNGKWMRMSGTSMATPMVSGTGALMLSLAPNLTSLGLKNGILNAVDEQTSYRDLISTSGDLNTRKAVEQLSNGFQVWPARMTIKLNTTFQFYAYRPSGSVAWSVSPADSASIDSNGTLTASKVGDVTVIAKDSSGATASTIRVSIEEATKDARGCAQAASAAKMTPPQIAGSMINYGLPILVMAVVTRRKKKKSNQQT